MGKVIATDDHNFVNHSSRRRMVATASWDVPIEDTIFQPLLTKKDGCDDPIYLAQGIAIVLSTTPHEEGWLRLISIANFDIFQFFQPLLTKKDGCDFRLSIMYALSRFEACRSRT